MKQANCGFKHQEPDTVPWTEELLIEAVLKPTLRDRGSLDFICEYAPVLKAKVLARLEKLK